MRQLTFPQRRQRGLSMIEVLVAIVILSLGLLGVAGLQAAGLRASHSAHYRAQAAQFAADMAERMRANLGQAANYALTLAATGPGAGCTGVCAADITDWLARLRTLPGGDGAIQVDLPTRTVTIVVQWDDSRGGGANNATHTVVTRLWNTN
ncbi:MAG: type IV pilus modification protein PilV [Burkholderiaceae bacterium]|nr:type IV pilus modification protein PilV [Burkholderiaceae bacterium]